jgi:putative transposase
MGRVDSRTLTHKGIEFEGLLYNSPELTEMRRKEGANLAVEIRINESDISSIYVLSPKTSKAHSVPAIDHDYAAGISLWQHKVIKNYQRRHSDADQSVHGWLQAKSEISRLIDESLKLKRTRTHKRIARYRETPEKMPFERPTGEFQAQALTDVTAGGRVVEPLTSVGAKDQASIQLCAQVPPVTRPRFKAEIRETYEDQ